MATNRASVDGVKNGKDVGRRVAPQGRTRKRKRFQHGNYTGKPRCDAMLHRALCDAAAGYLRVCCTTARFVSGAVDLGIGYGSLGYEYIPLVRRDCCRAKTSKPTCCCLLFV